MARTTRKSLVTILALFTAAAFAGCGPTAEQKKITDLTSENDQLKRDLADRDRALNDAQLRDEDARKTIADLNSQLTKFRAEGSKATKDGEWTSFTGFDMISIPGSVLFESGKSDLKASAKSTLNRIVSDVRGRFPDRDIYVFGHTDDEPIKKSKWRDNWELGAHRSLEVVRYLRTRGVPNETLIQASCAEYRPRTPNAGEPGRRQNRRVEFYAVQKKSGLIDTSAARANTGD